MPMKPHILIVEDDETVLSFIALCLEREGYQVSKAMTGAQGIGTFDKEAIDLILLDLNLPDGDGLSIAQQIRARSAVPIIILTARKGQDDRLLGLGIGADEYLVKPVDPKELFLRVRNLLNRSGNSAQRSTALEKNAATTPSAEFPSPVALSPSPDGRRRAPVVTLIAMVFLFSLAVSGGIAWWFFDRDQKVGNMPEARVDASLATKDGDPQRLKEIESDLPLAATSYSWVLRSKCDKVPYVSWWKARTHADIVGYVIRRYAGDWKPYVDDWTARLVELQDSYSRGKGVRTPNGEVLIGQALKGQIDKTKKRLDVILCLSREAAEYSHRKIERTR